MERLEEYAEEESPFTEQENLQIDPIQDEITTISLELLQTVKELNMKWNLLKKKMRGF